MLLPNSHEVYEVPMDKVYVLSECEKKKVLDSLVQEFGVKWKYSDLQYLNDSDFESRLKFEPCSDRYKEKCVEIIGTCQSKLELVEKMAELRYETTGEGALLIAYDGNIERTRWSFFWGSNPPFKNLWDVCRYPLKITNYKGSNTDKLCRKIHQSYKV